MAGLFAATALLACTSPSGDPIDGGAPGHDADTPPAAELEVIGEGSITLLFEEQANFEVRYTEADGTPIPDAHVGMALIGRAHDSSLAALETETNEEGVARGRVMAGRTTAAFRIRVSADRAAPVTIDVSVGDAGFGGLHVSTRYEGERPVEERVVAVFAGVTCEEPGLVTGSGDRSHTLADGTEETRFFALPAGIAYAVVSRGMGPAGEMLAYGCTDGVEIAPDEEREADVAMEDLPLVVDGEYEVVTQVGASVPVATLADRLRTAGETAVVDAGGDPALLLDGIDATLRDMGMTAEADALMMERASGDMDATLESQLDAAGVGPIIAVGELAMLLERRMERIGLVGALTVDTSSPDSILSWSMSRVSTRSAGDPDSARLDVDLAALGFVPMAAVEGTLLLEEDAFDVSRFWVTLPLGTLGIGALSALADESRVDGTAGLMLSSGGCSTLESFAAAQPLIDDACGASCVAQACKGALESLVMPMRDALDALDPARAVITMSGRLELVDEAADRRVDAMSGDLSGEWRSRDGSDADPVEAALSGARMIE